MGTVYPELDERLIAFIAKQPMFFVATAPCLDTHGVGGHVNVSPKGYRDTFAVLDSRTVAYLDLTGSGAETIAHLRQNGRITIMFCSFDRSPKILRIYGSGRVILPTDSDWPGFAAHFPGADDGQAVGTLNRPAHSDDGAGAANGLATASGATARLGTAMDRASHRAIIVVTADRITDSCGYAVPVMNLAEERDLLVTWAERKSAEELAAYRVKHNSLSIDNLPALG